MAQTTEAACLLQTGALYTRRVGLMRPDGRLVFAGIKRGAFSLYFDDAPIYHFDLEGRWQRAFLEAIHYRKAIDNSVDSIDRVRRGENLTLARRALPFAEVADLDASIREVALELLDGLGAKRFAFVAPPAGVTPLGEDELRDLLERVAGWDASAWFAHRERLLAIRAPLGFLPPDAHQTIVLQATIGDDRPRGFGNREPIEHAARSPSEFLSYARAVAKFLGRRVLQSNGVFLGGGDVLSRPFGDVTAYFEAVAEVFPLRTSSGPLRLRDRPEDAPSLGGIDVFLDVLGPSLPDRQGWAALKARGLRRVNLGIESGDPKVRRRYGSTMSDPEIREAVADAKGAGLALGAVVLADAGGRDMADAHASATASLLDSLGFGRGDLIYLTDSSEVSGGVSPEGIEALSDEEKAAQSSRIKSSLADTRARGAKVASYSVEKLWN